MNQHLDTSDEVRSELFGEDDFTLDDTSSPPRRRLTRITLVLGALVMVGAGFVGGIVTTQRVEGADASALAEGIDLPEGVELPEGFDPSAILDGGGLPTGATALPGVPVGGGDVSTVSLVDGDVLYVQDPDGTTVKVVLDDRAEVRTVGPGTLSDLREGDTVTLRGTEEAPGRFRARAIIQTGP